MMKITQTMMFAAQGHDAQGARLRVAAEHAPTAALRSVRAWIRRSYGRSR
jgi:hypothetical protein